MMTTTVTDSHSHKMKNQSKNDKNYSKLSLRIEFIKNAPSEEEERVLANKIRTDDENRMENVALSSTTNANRRTENGMKATRK